MNLKRLYEIFDAKYVQDFSNMPTWPTEEDFRGNPREESWHDYLTSIGCKRTSEFTDASNTINCPDSTHGVYHPYYIQVPKELAFKALVVGFLP